MLLGTGGRGTGGWMDGLIEPVGSFLATLAPEKAGELRTYTIRLPASGSCSGWKALRVREGALARSRAIASRATCFPPRGGVRAGRVMS